MLVKLTPGHHESHAKHVKATWGKRCNILFFVSSVENDTLPSIAYKGNESRNILWGKTKLGFQVKLLKKVNFKVKIFSNQLRFNMSKTLLYNLEEEDDEIYIVY